MRVLGVDPGAVSGWTVTNERSEVVWTSLVKVNPGVGLIEAHGQYRRALGHVFRAVGTVNLVAIEDPTAGAFYRGANRIKGTVRLQQLYCMLVAVFLEGRLSLDYEIRLVPVASWYPRLRGQLLRKPMALKVLRQASGLKDEHQCMAWGVARWGVSWVSRETARECEVSAVVG